MSIQSIKRRTGDEIFRANDVKAISYKAERGLSEKLEGNHRKLLNSSTLPKKDCFFSLWEENELLRIPAAMEEVTKHLERGCSVVVFVNFNSTRSRLEELFLERGVQSKRIGMLHGTQPREERERVVRGFMEDRIWLLLANIKVGGMALSLHDLRGKRQRVSVIFPTWSATQLKQALGRIYRANARSDAIQRILFCSSEGGIEERLCDLMNEKLRNLELLHTGGEELDLLSELFQQLM